MTFRRTGCVHILGTITSKAMHISNYWKSMCPCLCYDIIRYLADILQYYFLWGEYPHGLAQKMRSWPLACQKWLAGLDAVPKCGGAPICKPETLSSLGCQHQGVEHQCAAT